MLLVLMPPLPVFPFHLVVEPVKVDVRVMPELQPVPVGLVLASIPGMVFMPVFVINSSFALFMLVPFMIPVVLGRCHRVNADRRHQRGTQKQRSNIFGYCDAYGSSKS